MEPFIDSSRRWPAGQRIWHVYATPSLDTPDNVALAAVLRHHHTLLSTHPLDAHLSAVPLPWLHATVRKLSLDPTSMSDSDRRTYIQALSEALATTPAFGVECTPTVNTWSTLLHIDDPKGGFDALQEAVAQATRACLGDEALHHPANPPHLTTGYCTSTTHTAPYERPTHAAPVSWTVDTLVLANVLQDPVRHQYRWDTLATFPLRKAATS